MGAKISKIDQGINEDEPVEASVPSTPVHTPKTRILEADPRSPTANILRTPIQVTNGFIKNGSPAIGVINSSDFQTDLDDSTCEYPKVNLDPRSPTVEFTRTPIVVEKLPTKLHNKNLDNVRKQISDLSSFKNTVKNEKTVNTPILLESSPINKKVVEAYEKRNSFIGLLETNLDYVETNLDTVFKKCGMQNITPTDNESNINEIEDDPQPVPEIVRTPAEISQIDQIYLNKDVPSPISEEESVSDIIEKTLRKINQIDKETKEIIAITQSPVIVLESHNPTNDFDQKVTHLIYQDEECKEIFTPKKLQKSKENNRTPLGVRNDNNIKINKSVNKLKVHNKPTKGDYTVSKIPIYKDKKAKKGGNVQCENTPPCNIPELKRKSHWDADNTLII